MESENDRALDISVFDESIDINNRSATDSYRHHKKITNDDFRLVKVLGRGSYGKVLLVEKKDTSKYLRKNN